MASEELKVAYFDQPVSNSIATIFASLSSLKLCQLGYLPHEVFYVRIKYVNKSKALKNNV